MLEKFKLVDLTLPLNSKTITWTGRCGFHCENALDYKEHGLRVQKLRMHAGMGTHMDAPSHFFEQGRQIADIPLENCFAKLYVLSLEGEMELSADHILAFEKEQGKIEKGAFFCFNSGWMAKISDSQSYLNRSEEGRLIFPGFLPSAAEILLERKVVGIGIDTPSPDGANQTTFPVHHLILGAGCYIIENVFNLPLCPSKDSYIISLPLRLTEGTESPVRSLALIPKMVY